MFCKKCGAQNPDHVSFCSSCGEPLTPKANVQHEPQFSQFSQSEQLSQSPQPVQQVAGQQFAQPQQMQTKHCQCCGAVIHEDATICPSCGVAQYVDPAKNDKGSIGWGFLGFFFPLIGLILFLCWNRTKPNSAKKSGIGALIGSVGVFALGILSAILIPVFANTIEQANRKSALSDVKNALQNYMAEMADGANSLPSGSMLKVRKGSKEYRFIYDGGSLDDVTDMYSSDIEGTVLTSSDYSFLGDVTLIVNDGFGINFDDWDFNIPNW